MKIGYFANVVQQFLVAAVLAGCAVQPSVAQVVIAPYSAAKGSPEPTVRDCSTGGEKASCVDVVVRYHLSKNEIEFLDPVGRKAIARCQLCDPKLPGCNPCKGTLGTNLLYTHTVWFTRTKKNPHECITVGYSGGNPVQACFPD